MAEYSDILERISTSIAKLETMILSRPATQTNEVERLSIKNRMLTEDKEQLLYQLNQAVHVIEGVLKPSDEKT